MIKKRFREYFTFTKKERNGLVVLLLILFILILIRIYQSNKSYGEIVLIDDEFKNKIEQFEQSLTRKKLIKKEKQTLSYNRKLAKKTEWTKPELLFNFDPNKASTTELKSLGFTERQINTLVNYRKKGGVFYEKEDLLKVYGLEKEQFNMLESYIIIDVQNKQEITIIKDEIKELLEINTASKEELMELKGIGTSFANLIIKYRNLLGGYYQKDQLLEVYGMDSARYVGFINDILIDTNQINKLNLNNADFKILVRHPYISKYQTKAILKYRELEGDFTNIEQIHQNNLLLKDEYLRVKPYLRLK